MSERPRILSLGAGVQSSALALLAEHGDIEPVDFAVFADTGDEPDSVYDWLEELSKMVSYPVYWTQSHYGKLSDNLLKDDFSQIPAFTLNDKGDPAKGRRQCTKYWKIRPVNKEIRRRTGTFRKKLPENHFQVLKGISVDEALRAKDDRERSNQAVFPLLDAGISRDQCRQIVEEKTGQTPPRSACYYCPYKSKDEWEEISETKHWEHILEIDSTLNSRGEFLHSSCRPIKEKPWRNQAEEKQLNMFLHECEGMCGM